MQNAGIFFGDILVVDRSLTAQNKSIIVAILNGEFTVKCLVHQTDVVYLLAENPAYSPLKLNPESDFEVWGVIMYAIHKQDNSHFPLKKQTLGIVGRFIPIML